MWKIVAESLQCERLGKKRRIEADDYRTPHIELLYGPHGWVEHIDNGVKYITLFYSRYFFVFSNIIFLNLLYFLVSQVFRFKQREAVETFSFFQTRSFTCIKVLSI